MADNLLFQGTSGSDFFRLSGEEDDLEFPLTNAYDTGGDFSVDINNTYNVNGATYNGGGGTDYVIMTNLGDALFLQDESGDQKISSVEVFVAGDGGDIIDLSNRDITLGDVIIDGGRGDDVLWANAGDDQIVGFDGNDHIHGGPGNDDLSGGRGNDTVIGGTGNDLARGNEDHDQLYGLKGQDNLYGNNGNDVLYGGEDSDYISGGSGDDVLYGGNNDPLKEVGHHFDADNLAFPNVRERTDISDLDPPGDAALGVMEGDLQVDYATTATLTIQETGGSFRNAFGHYTVGPDGTMNDVDIVFENMKTLDKGESFQFDVDGQAGHQLGFFTLANGYNMNQRFRDMDVTEDGSLQFVYGYGGADQRAAKTSDDAGDISLVYNSSDEQTVLKGFTYHTHTRGDSTDINWDGKSHVISGFADESDTSSLRIGFEDLPNTGDADYNDIVFDLSFGTRLIDVSEQSADTLDGGAGNDLLYGEGGDDLLLMGEGGDTVSGGMGADIFALTVIDDALDTITDFAAGQGDVLNIFNILDGFDPVQDVISEFISLSDNGEDTVFSVNADGDRGGAYTDVIRFEGGLDSTLTEMIEQGNLVADTSAL